MRLVAITLAITATVGIPGSSIAGDAPKRSAEVQVLDRFIGNWETEISVKPTGDKFNTTESRKWSREGTFVLSEDLNVTTKKEAHFLLTYDSNAKAFRACYIDEGNAVIFLGTWDEGSQTIKWASPDGAGAKHTGTYRFIDKDHVEWSMTVTGPDGKVVVELSAKQTRKK
jgi:hypothetical protein